MAILFNDLELKVNAIRSLNRLKNIRLEVGEIKLVDQDFSGGESLRFGLEIISGGGIVAGLVEMVTPTVTQPPALLLEDGSYFLLENGGRLLLE